jgi:hypothetical protein
MCDRIHYDYNANAAGAAAVPTTLLIPWPSGQQATGVQVWWNPIANGCAAPALPIWQQLKVTA